MKHLLKAKVLLCSAFLCMGITMASAQNTTAPQVQGTDNTGNQIDPDAAKLQELKSQSNNPEEMKARQAEEAKVQQDAQKLDQERVRQGYLAIPGFVYTGDPAVDAVNYENAKTAFKNNDPAKY